jgi:hypothetical protein
MAKSKARSLCTIAPVKNIILCTFALSKYYIVHYCPVKILYCALLPCQNIILCTIAPVKNIILCTIALSKYYIVHYCPVKIIYCALLLLSKYYIVHYCSCQKYYFMHYCPVQISFAYFNFFSL